MANEFLTARAKIRADVRYRLSGFEGQDIWHTTFFVNRLDLTNVVIEHIGIKREGVEVEPSELINIVRDEFFDFVLVKDDEHAIDVSDIEAPQNCENCGCVFNVRTELICSQCQHPVLFQVSKKALMDIRFSVNFEMQEADPIRRRAVESLYIRRLESAYLNIVVIFEHFCNQLNRYLCLLNRVPERWPSFPNGNTIRNPFQKTQYDRSAKQKKFMAHDWFITEHSLDLFTSIKKTDADRMWLVFQKRHLLQHQGGIIDQHYVDNTGGNNSDVGNPVQIKKDELDKVVKTIQSIVQYTKAQYT